MLVEHGGLMVFLLLGAAAHATLLEALSERGVSLGFLRMFVLIAPIVVTPLGELIAIEARSRRARRAGLYVAAIGALGHLLIDVACFALPWLTVAWPWLLASSTAAMIVMALSLRFTLRWLIADQFVTFVGDLTRPPASWATRLERELFLVGGTAIAMAVVSLGFVAMALVGVARHPERWLKLSGGAIFFAGCAVVAARMGLDRRRALLASARSEQ